MDIKADAEDTIMQQVYTSPSAEAADAGPYYGTAPSRDQDIGEEPRPPGTQDAPEPTSPHRHRSRVSVSAEELQLAAQLTQGLAPMMAAHNQAQEEQYKQAQEADTQAHETAYEDQSQGTEYQEQSQAAEQQDNVQEAEYQDHVREQEYQDQVQDPAYQDQVQGPGYQDQAQSDANLRQQLQTQLQNHEQELQNILRVQAQAQGQSQTPEQSPYQPPLAGGHLEHHMSLSHLGHQYQLPDSIPPRKRSKVSRACDECRRKKIKCDAQSEGSEEPCSNCRRSSSKCQFSRIPQKRGPSKGYIKELADRINSIEGKLGGGATDLLDSPSQRASAEAFSSPLPLEDSRKRPFSSISTDQFATPTTPRHAVWATEPRPIQPYQPPPSFRGTPYSANGLAPQPAGLKADTPRIEPQIAGASQLDPVMGELNEVTWYLYKAAIHQTFPILATDSSRVQSLIALCPVHLREAFLEAFYAALKHTQGLPVGTAGDSRTANKLLTEWETEGNSRSFRTDLVHLQTLLLMAIETDSHGPLSVKGYHGGPPKTSFIGRALALAYSMGLHGIVVDEELDEDMEDKVALRAWWSLVMMDRWNSIGAAIPAQIPIDTVVVLPGLKPIMGDGPYALIHLSVILGHFVPMALQPPKQLGSQEGPIISSWVNLGIESFRLNLPSHITPGSHRVTHLAYWHCRLLAYLFMPSSLCTDALWAAKESVALLVQHPQLQSPLNHHFSALTAVTLLELAKVPKARDEATKLLREMLETPFAPSAWGPAIRAKISDKLRPTAITALDSQSLQHLADLATATTELAAAVSDNPGPAEERDEDPPVKYRTAGAYEDLGFDPRPLLQTGYLNAFGQRDQPVD